MEGGLRNSRDQLLHYQRGILRGSHDVDLTPLQQQQQLQLQQLQLQQRDVDGDVDGDFGDDVDGGDGRVIVADEEEVKRLRCLFDELDVDSSGDLDVRPRYYFFSFVFLNICNIMLVDTTIYNIPHPLYNVYTNVINRFVIYFKQEISVELNKSKNVTYAFSTDERVEVRAERAGRPQLHGRTTSR
jgi:hypothetical protein